MATAAQAPVKARTVGVVVVVGVVTALVAAAFSGAAAPLALGDAGPLVRWGLPVVSVVGTLLGCATLGLLLLAAFLAPERTHTDRRRTATRLASLTAGAWAIVTALDLVLTFADMSGSSLLAPGFAGQLAEFAWSLETTRILLIVTAIPVVVAIAARLTTSHALMAWMALAVLVAMVVPALTGHSAGSASHEDAVNALGVHLLGISVWVGGLIALVLMRPRLGSDLGVTVARYSVLAAWCYALVALSGIQQAVIRLGSISGVTTAYGAMVAAKAAILVVLGVAGWRQRRIISATLTERASDSGAFARLAVVEVVLMGVAAGLSAVLARSAPPVPDALPDPGIVLDLSGFPDPGPYTAASWLTAWRVEWLFLALAVVAVGLYVAGVARLHRRGDRWPVGRTICWVLGWLAFVYATSGALEIWGRVLFSVHMLMHMIVSMIVPLLLVPAAPITLMLRALHARTDKTWGPREVILHVVHSRLMVWLANPVVAAALFFASLALFYWTPLFELALTTHTGHLMMMGHFMVTGYLFVWVLIGIDPGPPKWSPMMLLTILFATVAFHAFFGVALTEATSLLAPGFFGQIDLPWGPDPLQDQVNAGKIAWGITEAPTLILALLVALNWTRDDAREARRTDRQADRDGGAELAAYNDYLAHLRDMDRELDGRPGERQEHKERA